MLYHNHSSAHPLLKARVGIPAEVVLGSPKKDCDGIGICRIERVRQNQHTTRNATTTKRICCRARALLVTDSNRLIFYFIRHTLPACVLKKQFSNGLFQLSDPCPLPEDVAEELGLARGLAVRPGCYHVSELGGHVAVSVNLY